MIRRFERRLLYYVRRLVDDERDAWDVLQQTWLAAYQGLGRLDDPRALRTWLYRIAHHQAVSHHRRRRAGTAQSAAADPSDLGDVPDDSSDDRTWAAEAAEQVHAGLSALSIPHREVLTLHFLEDLSVEETATVLGVPPGTVKSRLYYAKRALRDVLERGGAG